MQLMLLLLLLLLQQQQQEQRRVFPRIQRTDVLLCTSHFTHG